MRNYLIAREMTLEEVQTFGKVIRLFDGSIRFVRGELCQHSQTNILRPLSECFEFIKNVKDANGEIIAKRLSTSSQLLYTKKAFQPYQPFQQSKNILPSSPVHTPKNDIQHKRIEKYKKSTRAGKPVKVSICLKDTRFSNRSELELFLKEKGAKQISFYETDKGLAVVVDPISLLDEVV